MPRLAVLAFALVLAVAPILGAPSPARAEEPVTLFARGLLNPMGITLDADKNVFVTSDGVSDVLLTKFAPDGQPIGQVPFGGFTCTECVAQLAFDPGMGLIWEVQPNGNVFVIDPATGQRAGVLPLRSVGVDTSQIYDIVTGTTGPQLGLIQPQLGTYGDIALLRRGERLDVFITGSSIATPFVVRIRIRGTTIESVRAIVTTRATNAPLSTLPRGIAVNSQGRVLTALPFQPSREGVIDNAVSFSADFPEGQGTVPTPLFDGEAFTSRGMTADGAGKFYAVVGVTTQACGFRNGFAVFSPDLRQGTCFPTGTALDGRGDIATTPDGRFAYVTSVGHGTVVRFDLGPGDETGPTISGLTLTATSGTDRQHVVGTTLYYNPSGAGGFRVDVVATDEQSGIRDVAFPNVFGTDGATVTDGPYRHTYSWTGGATASGAKEVRATNGVGLSSTSAFTVTPDSAGPAVTLTAPADGATVSGTVAVSATATDPAAGAGMARVEFRVCPGTTCPAGSGTFIGTDTTPSYATTWTVPATPGPYAIVARATDNVGNAADSAPVTVTVTDPPDITPPDISALTLTETEPDEHARGTTLFYNPSSASGGSFRVDVVAADDESGIRDVAFPNVFGGDGGTDPTGPPYQHTYAWTAGANATGARQVAATNGANLAATAGFTVTPDTANPAATITSPRANATVGAGAVVKVRATDVGSGVARVLVRYCPGTNCVVAQGKAVGSDSTAPFQVAWSRLPRPGTYTLVAQVVDNVGRVGTSRPVMVTVDTGARGVTEPAPDAPAADKSDTTPPRVLLTAPAAGRRLVGHAVLIAEATDEGGSGVAEVVFQARPARGGAWVTLGQTRAAPYERRVDLGRLAEGGYVLRAVATDEAGNTTASAPIRVTVADRAAVERPPAEADEAPRDGEPRNREEPHGG